MALTEQEKNDYIEQFILPVFNQLNFSTICSSLFNTTGEVIALTNQIKYEYGIDQSANPRNNVLINPEDKELAEFTQVSPEYAKNLKKMCEVIVKLQQIVIKEKTMVNYNSTIPRHGIINSRLNHIMPIIHPSGEVIAIQQMSSQFRILTIHDYFKFLPNHPLKRNSVLLSEELYKLPIKLSPRQYEILFFLLSGYSQSTIATFLDLNRGTVSKVLAEQICPKFDIYDSNTMLLIKKAKAKNYHKYIPFTLCRPCIIGLDPYIIDKYFAGNSCYYPASDLI